MEKLKNEVHTFIGFQTSLITLPIDFIKDLF